MPFKLASYQYRDKFVVENNKYFQMLFFKFLEITKTFINAMRLFVVLKSFDFSEI